MATFTPEQLNFFKFSSLVVDEFPEALRHALVYMWDTLVSSAPSFKPWDDSDEVRNMFLKKEGSKTTVPTSLSFKEWDFTVLIKATLYAKSFAVQDGRGSLRTLSELYVEPRGLSSGEFHPSAQSPVGDKAETFALALDQLRRLRNTIFHLTSTQIINKEKFDSFVNLAKGAFAAVGHDCTEIYRIGNLGEEDFPTARLQQLESDLMHEKNSALRFETELNNVRLEVENVTCSVTEVKTEVGNVKEKVKDVHSEMGNFKLNIETTVKDMKTDVESMKSQVEALQRESVKGASAAPEVGLPDKVPCFFGRQSECSEILHHLTTGKARLVDIWGPPGFGKSTVAINVAHSLRELHIPAYFISVHGMKSKDELVSKLLLTLFPGTNPVANISHTLVQCFRNVQIPYVLILDNADDLLESQDPELKNEVLRFIEEIFAQCSFIQLLFTTRASLDYLRHKMSSNYQPVKVTELDKASSADLVRFMLPDVQHDECSRVVKTCGQVPLAIKLMCSIVENENISMNELFDELKSVPVVDFLDNENLPNDIRLKYIFNTSFQRLGNDEREAFVTLTVFSGCFGQEEANHLLGCMKTRPTKLLQSLQQKSFVDSGDRPKSFKIHSLLLSFINEKTTTDGKLADVFRAAQLRFYTFFVSQFEAANSKFLGGYSVEAMTAFRNHRESIVLSLTEGVQAEDLEVYRKCVDALSKAELFLYAVLQLSDKELFFNQIFDAAVNVAKKKLNYDDECKLMAAKAFGQLGWFHSSHPQWDESLQAGITAAEDFPAKLLCYLGVHQLLSGNLEEGALSLKSAVGRLSCRCDEEILKVLSCHILAVVYRTQQDEEAASDFADRCSTEIKSNPACLALSYLFSIITTSFEEPGSRADLSIVAEQDTIMFVIMAKLLPSLYKVFATSDVQNETKTMTQCLLKQYTILEVLFLTESPPFEILESCCDALKNLNCYEEAVKGFQIITNSLEKARGEHKDTARNMHFLGLSYEGLKNYRAAFECFKRALEIREKLLNQTVDDVDSQSCVMIGEAIGSLLGALKMTVELSQQLSSIGSSDDERTVCDLNDFKPSCNALENMLKNKVKVSAVSVLDIARNYDMLGECQHLIKDHKGAIESYQQAIKMRDENIGEHVHTALSLTKLGCVRFSVNQNMEANDAFQRSLNMRKRLRFDDDQDTACVYYNLGENYLEMGNYEKSLEAHLQVLEFREKHLGENILTATSYHRVGFLYCKTGNYQSAVKPFQNALQLRENLLGRHEDTASSYHDLAAAYLEIGSYSEALEVCRKALEMRLELIPGYEETATTFHLQGSIFSKIGDLALAAEAFDSASLSRAALFEDHVDTALSFHCLGQARLKMGNYNGALDPLLEASRLRQKLLGDHSDTADTFELLARTYEALGAEDLSSESLVIAIEIKEKLRRDKCVDTAFGDPNNSLSTAK